MLIFWPMGNCFREIQFLEYIRSLFSFHLEHLQTFLQGLFCQKIKNEKKLTFQFVAKIIPYWNYV